MADVRRDQGRRDKGRKEKGRRDKGRKEKEQDEFQERVIRIDRTRKTVKGGRISSSRVCAVVGDGRGNVGFGMGKALSATDGIGKALERARKSTIRVPLEGYTIPHEVQAKVGGAVILLKPASRGTGIIAGGAVRQIIEVSGIRDVLTKSLGSGNVMNRAKACFKALEQLRQPVDVASERGKSVKELLNREVQDGYEQEEVAAAEKKAVEEAAAADAALQAAVAAAVAEAEAEAVDVDDDDDDDDDDIDDDDDD